MRNFSAWLLALLLLLPLAGQAARAKDCPAPAAAVHERWRGEAQFTALAAQDYRIGNVHIVVDDVFDLSDPAQQTWYARLADELHVKTRPGVIRAQLLFKSGEPLDPRTIYESDRRLRALKFLRAALILPESCAQHTVNLRVDVKDAWTLKLNFRFAHVGGQNTTQLLVTDANFLGSGKQLSLGHSEDPQRSANLIVYQDPSVFGSYWQMNAAYEDLSDGHLRFFNVGQPFYEDQTPWSLAIGFLDQKENLNLYNQGALAWNAASSLQQHELSWAHLLNWAGDSGMRAGLVYSDSDYGYGPPQLQTPSLLPAPVLTPRRLAGLGATWEFFQDNYTSYTNLKYIGRTEDYNLGWQVDAQAGAYGGGLGGNVSAPFYGLSASWGDQLSAHTLLLASAYAQGRQQDGVSRNLLTNLTLTAYNQDLTWQTLVAHVQWDSVLRPDPESYLYIGGLQGLRGYPNYFAIGDRRWQATFADRIVTPWQVWSLFQMGFVGFVDVAQIHQLSPPVWTPAYSDVGLGLRFGITRSAFSNTVYVTVAWPLRGGPGVHGHEIVVGNIVNF
ncbi:MAG: hypothetical protein KGQ68_02900 [Gammaproteobacteria bacterium]|nr:hypothetical protein [Gammaproteobacteria bacterium]